MEIKLTVALDENTSIILTNLTEALRGTGAVVNEVPVTTKPKTVEKAEEVKEVKEEVKEEVTQDVDLTQARKDIKAYAVDLCKNKRRSELAELNAKYGISKIQELDDEVVLGYLNEVKTLAEMEF